MDDSNEVHAMDGNVDGASKISYENQLSVSFILEKCLNDHEVKEYYRGHLNAPLWVSRTYEEEFFDCFHMNYYGEFEEEGIFLASIKSVRVKSHDADKNLSMVSVMGEDKGDQQLIRAIIRTQHNNYDVSDVANIRSEANVLQCVLNTAELPPPCYCELISDIEANTKILEFDKQNDRLLANKVAVVLQRSNQSSESEILNNNEISKEMEDFLSLISERVELKGFTKYRGDLDTKSNQHGTYSYFSVFENREIMFNIAPLIPITENDSQCIQRKSLISNALLCIVFQEPGSSPFRPDSFLGKVTQVYIVVQPFEIDGDICYKVEIWRRPDIEPLVDLPGGIYKYKKSFRNYFLTLLFNSIHIILKKELFNRVVVEQRHRLKHESLQELCQKFQSYDCKRDSLTMCDHNADNDMEDIGPLNRRNKADLKQHSSKLLPKLIETFSNGRSKPIISASNPVTPNISESNTSSIAMKRSLRKPNLTSMYSKKKNGSLMSLFNSSFHRQDSNSKDSTK